MPQFIEVSSNKEAVDLAKKYREKTGNLKGGNLYVLPDGQKLRVRVKDASTGRLAAENYQTKASADIKRSTADKVSTDEAESSRKQIFSQARELNQHPLTNVYGKFIVEHNVALHDEAHSDGIDAPGDPSNLSISDPAFKVQKDTLEALNRASNNPFVVAINEITGEARLIPRGFFDAIVDPSNLPGFNVGLDVNPRAAFGEAMANLPGLASKSPGTIEFNAGLGTQAYQALLRNKRMTAFGVGMDVLTDENAQTAILKGDVKEAATQLATGAAIGNVAGQVLKLAPTVAKLAGPVGAAMMGKIVFDQGKQGSFVNKAVDKIAKVLPNQTNPKTDLGKRAGDAIANELKYALGQIRLGILPYTR